MKISIKLSQLAPDFENTIPATFVDKMMGFDLNKADISFVAQIIFDNKVDFYITSRKMNKINRDNSLNHEHTIQLDTSIANLLHTHAVALSAGKRFQFYRIIIVFKQIYDIPQTCFCGLCGFNNFELYKIGTPIRIALRNAINNHSGAIAKNHSLYIDLNKNDTIDHHGAAFIP